MGNPLLWFMLFLLGIRERREDSLWIARVVGIIVVLAIAAGAIWFALTDALNHE